MVLDPEYIETFNEKWNWPAEIEKAELHEKATSI